LDFKRMVYSFCIACLSLPRNHGVRVYATELSSLKVRLEG
jgi:hypothetical protein